MLNDIPYSTRDVGDALADYLCYRADRAPVDNHPLAEELSIRASRVSLDELVRHFARLPPGRPIEVRHLTQSDFAESLSVAVARIVAADYSAASDETIPIVRDVTSSGVRPVEAPELALGDVSAVHAPTLMPLATIQTGETATPILYAARFLIGRELILADEAGIIAAVASQLGGMAARIEAQLVAGILNAPTELMADGSARFIASTNETTAAPGLDVGSVDEAAGLLRIQPFGEGGYANVAAKTLLVPPSKQATAWTLNEALGRPLGVVSNAWLDGSAAFLFADPIVASSLIRARPRGYDKPGVYQTPAMDEGGPDGKPLLFDGMAFKFEHITGIGFTSRRGCVRIPLS